MGVLASSFRALFITARDACWRQGAFVDVTVGQPPFAWLDVDCDDAIVRQQFDEELGWPYIIRASTILRTKPSGLGIAEFRRFNLEKE